MRVSSVQGANDSFTPQQVNNSVVYAPILAPALAVGNFVGAYPATAAAAADPFLALVIGSAPGTSLSAVS